MPRAGNWDTSDFLKDLLTWRKCGIILTNDGYQSFHGHQTKAADRESLAAAPRPLSNSLHQLRLHQTVAARRPAQAGRPGLPHQRLHRMQTHPHARDRTSAVGASARRRLSRRTRPQGRWGRGGFGVLYCNRSESSRVAEIFRSADCLNPQHVRLHIECSIMTDRDCKCCRLGQPALHLVRLIS